MKRIFKFKRGFKTNAEKKAIELRNELSLESHEYLCARKLANFLNVKVITPNELIGYNKQFVTKLLSYDTWSAITLFPNNNFLVILNSTHSEVRQESDLFHELSHILCKHEMTGFNNHGLRDYDETQEEEAKWLGACLHIPRTSLEWAFKKNMSPLDICSYYKASNQMLTYRINVTGIKHQYTRYASKFL